MKKLRPDAKQLNSRASLEAAFAAFQVRARKIKVEPKVCSALQPIAPGRRGNTLAGPGLPVPSDEMPPLL